MKVYIFHAFGFETPVYAPKMFWAISPHKRMAVSTQPPQYDMAERSRYVLVSRNSATTKHAI